MAKHTTHKAGLTGKVQTKARKAARAAKHSSPPLDTAALQRELAR